MKNVNKNKLIIGSALIFAGVMGFVLCFAVAIMTAEYDEATNTMMIVNLLPVVCAMFLGGLTPIGCVLVIKASRASKNETNTTATLNAGNNNVVIKQKVPVAKRKRILNVSHLSKFVISEDHAWFDGSSCCPVCSLYKGRVFSVSGKDTRFPPLVSLPDEIHDGKCDVCHCYYSLTTWFEGISSPDIVTAIQKSNAPLVDRRTEEQKQHHEKMKAKAERKAQKIKED